MVSNMNEAVPVLMRVRNELAEHVGDILHLGHIRRVHLRLELSHIPAIVLLSVLQHSSVNLAAIEQHREAFSLDIQLQCLLEQRHIGYHRETVVIEIHGLVSHFDYPIRKRGEYASSLNLVGRNGVPERIEIVGHLLNGLMVGLHHLNELYEVTWKQSSVVLYLHIGKLVLVLLRIPDLVQEVDGMPDDCLQRRIL